jgi:hypothetical protein
MRRRVASPGNNVLSLGKDPSSLGDNHVPNCFAIIAISCSFYINL